MLPGGHRPPAAGGERYRLGPASGLGWPWGHTGGGGWTPVSRGDWNWRLLPGEPGQAGLGRVGPVFNWPVTSVIYSHHR